MTISDDIPPTVEAAMRRLWTSQRDIHLAMRPRDAWVAVGLLQLAWRHPGLSPAHRAAAERIGRALQGALAQLAPDVAAYVEAGWDPAYDTPSDEEVERLRRENAAYREFFVRNNLEVDPSREPPSSPPLDLSGLTYYP